MWTRFVALGDSLTEGVGDPLLNGSLRGWAARLAVGLAQLNEDLVYVNLARRSLRTKDVIDYQLPRALELKPDLSSALVGMNDLTRPDFDSDTFHDELAFVVEELARSGATVLLGTFPDISRFLPAPERVRKSLHCRLERASEVVRSVASHDACILVDAWNMPETRARNIVSIDCMHPNSRGHALLAHAFGDMLAQRCGRPIELPEAPAGRLLSIESALHLRWIAVNAGPSVLRGIVRTLRRPPTGEAT
jgi:lysophospholipase L1-like esterase